MSIGGKFLKKCKKFGIDRDQVRMLIHLDTLTGKCSLCRTLSSSTNFNEMRLVCIFCLHIHYIFYLYVYIYIIFQWSRKLT